MKLQVMKSRPAVSSLVVSSLVVCVLASGCGQPPGPDSPAARKSNSSTGDSASGAGSQDETEPDFRLDEPNPPGEDGTTKAGATDTAVPKTPDASRDGTDAKASGEGARKQSATESVRDAGQATEPVADPNATAGAGEPGAGEPVDPLIEGLEFPNVDIRELYSQRKADYEKSPTDPEAAGKYIGLVQSLGIFRDEQGDKEIAAAAFRQSLQMVEKAIADGVPLDPALISSANFHQAMLLAGEGQPAQALNALRSALTDQISEQEVTDLLETVKTSTVMNGVRELPEFAEQLQNWETGLKARFTELAKSDLVNGTSFPLDFSLTDVHGQPLRLGDFRGKVCVVDVWGTWCGPCIRELPSFIELQKKFGTDGFQMIGLNEESGDQPEQIVTEYISKAGINYPCALINEEVQAQIPDFGGYPTTIFVDRHGKVRLKVTGWHDYAYLEAIIQILLAEAPPS